MDETTHLRDLLRPYRTREIQDATGISRSNAHNWRAGLTLPDARHLPALAEFLRVDLAALTRIVAREDSISRANRAVSRRVVA